MSTISMIEPVLHGPTQFKFEKDIVAAGDKIDLSHVKHERTFHDTNAAYVLPNDNIEHQRLELQHRLFRQLMGDKIFHAPLNAHLIHKTLDIGCGTGAVTHEMACTFPSAQVFGADLSPVPPVRHKLPNITYIQGNIMEEDMSDSRIEENTFDFIFSRLLVLGMSDWKAYVARCVALAKPGGWVEMHDLSHTVHHYVPSGVSSLDHDHLRPHAVTHEQIANASHPTDKYKCAEPWLWESTFHKLLALKDVDTRCGAEIPFLFKHAGLTDISIRRYMVPYSRWEGLTREEKEMADYVEGFVRDVIPVAIRKAGENAGVEYEGEVERAVADVKRYYEAYEGGRNFLWMYVVCGRKPE